MNTHALAHAIKNLGLFGLAAAVLVAVYWSGLYGGFFFDDEANILAAEGIKLDSFSLESIRQALNSGISGPLGRPISQLSFALNYFFSEFDPFAFKATNLVIHGLNGLLVFLITQQILKSTHHRLSPSDNRLLSGFVAMAWLLHPIQITSVLYVVQRMTSLSALFLLSAVLLHISARQRKEADPTGIAMLLAAWLLLWPLSTFSKESGLLFPGFVGAYELIIRRHAYKKLDQLAGTFSYLLAAAIAGGALYLLTPHAQWIWAGYELRTFSLYERALTECRALWTYLGLIFLPTQGGFSLYHDDFTISSSLLKPWTTLPSLLGLLGLIGAAWLTRTRFPLVTFAIAWFLIGHSLESTILPLEIAHEHRNYVPLFGILLLPLSFYPNTDSLAGKNRTTTIALLTAVIIVLALISALRAHQFGNEIRRTQIESSYHPNSPRANYEAGATLARALSATPDNLTMYVLTRKHFELAGQLDPSFKFGWLGLINLNCITNRPIEPSWIETLAQKLQHSPLSPGDITLIFNLKEMSIARTLCLSRAEAQTLFSAAAANTTISPSTRAMIYSWQADYLVLRESDPSAAREILIESLKINPNAPSNRLKLAQLVLLLGRADEALTLIKEVSNAQLSRSERRTVEMLLTCLEKDRTQCGKI